MRGQFQKIRKIHINANHHCFKNDIKGGAAIAALRLHKTFRDYS